MYQQQQKRQGLYTLIYMYRRLRQKQRKAIIHNNQKGVYISLHFARSCAVSQWRINRTESTPPVRRHPLAILSSTLLHLQRRLSFIKPLSSCTLFCVIYIIYSIHIYEYIYTMFFWRLCNPSYSSYTSPCGAIHFVVSTGSYIESSDGVYPCNDPHAYIVGCS